MIVCQLPYDSVMSMSMKRPVSSSFNRFPEGKKRSLSVLTVSSPYSKQGRSLAPIIIISTKIITLSACS